MAATPGVTPYCGGAHVWGASLDPFIAGRRVLVPDLPGCGGSFVPGGRPPTVALMTQQVAALIEALAFRPCHVVGHDLGGLIALALALALEAPALVRSVTVVASAAAAPSGDMAQNLALAYPPPPQWSRDSQAWALERLSYSHHHIDDALLDACAAAAAAAPHREAAAALAGAAFRKVFAPSVGAAKSRFFEQCRSNGMPVPVQVVWATHDPLTTPEHGPVGVPARRPTPDGGTIPSRQPRRIAAVPRGKGAVPSDRRILPGRSDAGPQPRVRWRTRQKRSVPSILAFSRGFAIDHDRDGMAAAEPGAARGRCAKAGGQLPLAATLRRERTMNQIAPLAKRQAKITVLNPVGYPPQITARRPAPRPESLDGKTVYLVDCRFDDSIELLKQVAGLVRRAHAERQDAPRVALGLLRP